MRLRILLYLFRIGRDGDSSRAILESNVFLLFWGLTLVLSLVLLRQRPYFQTRNRLLYVWHPSDPACTAKYADCALRFLLIRYAVRIT